MVKAIHANLGQLEQRQLDNKGLHVWRGASHLIHITEGHRAHVIACNCPEGLVPLVAKHAE